MKLPKFPKFSDLSARERLLAAGVVFVFSISLLDRVVLGPWWRHTQEVSQDIKRLEKAIRTYEQILPRKPQILAEVKAYSGYLHPAGSGQEDVAALLREIETLAKESDVSLGEVKPLTAPGDKSTQGYAIEVHYTGTLKQGIQFIYLLQTSKSLFQFDRAALSLKAADTGTLDGSLRLTRKGMEGQ